MTTYYVDADADGDAGAGTSQDTNVAWKTIAKVNATTFSAGDSILFKCGGLWRERLVPKGSGSVGNNITFSSYGTGDKPKIYASDLLTGWEVHSGNIWKAPHTGAVAPVWFVSGSTITYGDPKTAIVDCVNEFDWYYTANEVYVYAASDPDTLYDRIEGGYRTSGARNYDTNYITLDGFEVVFSAQNGVEIANTGYSGWIVQNCDIHHVGVIGASTANGIYSRVSDSLYANNTIYQAGSRCIYIVGGAASSSQLNFTVRDNELYDCGILAIETTTYNSGAVLSNIKIYRNIIYATAACPGTPSMIGIQFSASGGGICSNTVVAHNVLHSLYGIAVNVMANVADSKIVNNTIFTASASVDGISVSATAVRVHFMNNIVLEIGRYNINFAGVSAVSKSDFNISYHSTEATGVLARVVSTSYVKADFATYKSATGLDAHSVWDDPDFTDVASLDFTLLSSSPAIGLGAFVNDVYDQVDCTDFNGIAPNSMFPYAGAFDYAPTVRPTLIGIEV